MIMASAIGMYYFINQQHKNNNVIIQNKHCKYGRSKDGTCKTKPSKTDNDLQLAGEVGVGALQVGAALAA